MRSIVERLKLTVLNEQTVNGQLVRGSIEKQLEAKLPFEVLLESDSCSIDEAEQGHTDQGSGLRGQDIIISRHLSNSRRVRDSRDLLL